MATTAATETEPTTAAADACSACGKRCEVTRALESAEFHVRTAARELAQALDALRALGERVRDHHGESAAPLGTFERAMRALHSGLGHDAVDNVRRMVAEDLDG